MSKSTGRKKKKQQASREEVLALSEMAWQALMREREQFKEKFGRDWQPDDPIIFDPDSDVPQFYPEDRMRQELMEIMRKAGTPPEIIYAHKKTDLLLAEGVEVPEDRRREWDDAIAEYFELERKAKEGKTLS